MGNNITISQAQLKELLHYNPDTGIFTWLVNRGRARAGDIAGDIDARGYGRIGLLNSVQKSHRLAFLYMRGSIPKYVDHINHDRLDNRWGNLRTASILLNNKNLSMSKTNTSGFTGVSFVKRISKWRAYIKINYKNIHLGYFTELSDAVTVRKQAEIKHGFHVNHGVAL